MKILFSFETSRMPLRSATFVNWLTYRGHQVDILYDLTICHESMEGSHYFKNVDIINSVKDYNEYDIWFADLLNYKNYTQLSQYIPYFLEYKNKLCIIGFDDTSEFFEHRITDKVKEKVCCWANNLLEKDLEKYSVYVRNKCMLLPTYIEASNENYNEYINVYKKNITPFLEKKSHFYFSGAITGCMPAIDCRILSINTLSRIGVPHTIRVVGTDPTPFLKYFYDTCISSAFKMPHVDRLTFLEEMDTFKFILSPKGNCQPLRRQYESFAFNNLVFINENNVVDYLFEGTPNLHFISYKIDCSDLKDKLNYYYKNLDQAKTIADAGTKFWHENCKIHSTGNLSNSISMYILNNFKHIANICL